MRSNAISNTINNYSKMAMCLTQLTYFPPEKYKYACRFQENPQIYINISIERLWNGEINKTVLLTAFLSARSHLNAKVSDWNSDELIRYKMQSSIQITVQCWSQSINLSKRANSAFPFISMDCLFIDLSTIERFT